MQEHRHLAHDPASVSEARHALRAALEREGVGDSVVYDAILVLSELVSNAIQHGRADTSGSIDVDWRLDAGTLVLSVRDRGSGGEVHRLTPPLDSDRGRGLLIVDEVCADWQVEHGDGTRVIARLPIPVPA